MASKKGGNTEIASWNFNDNMNDSVISKFSLSDTIMKSKSKLAKGCIAPGTEGCFEIKVNSEGSKVKIDYDIRLLNEVNTPTNLYFMLLDNQNIYNSLTDLFNDSDFSGSIGIDEEQVKLYKIFWKWPFENYKEDGSIDEEKDEIDLQQAKLNLDYIFEIEITGKQSLN